MTLDAWAIAAARPDGAVPAPEKWAAVAAAGGATVYFDLAEARKAALAAAAFGGCRYVIVPIRVEYDA